MLEPFNPDQRRASIVRIEGALRYVQGKYRESLFGFNMKVKGRAKCLNLLQ